MQMRKQAWRGWVTSGYTAWKWQIWGKNLGSWLLAVSPWQGPQAPSQNKVLTSIQWNTKDDKGSWSERHLSKIHKTKLGVSNSWILSIVRFSGWSNSFCNFWGNVECKLDFKSFTNNGSELWKCLWFLVMTQQSFLLVQSHCWLAAYVHPWRRCWGSVPQLWNGGCNSSTPHPNTIHRPCSWNPKLHS